MPWRIAPERVVSEAAAELAALFGDTLRTVVLYGRSVRPGSAADRAHVDLAAVAEPLAFEHLQRVAQWWARWRRQRVTAPLLFSATDLARSRDVFPLEFLDIKAHHRTLAGRELFAELAVSRQSVRAECEREAKGKLLRLRTLYLDLCDSTRELRLLMLDSRRTFLAVMRGLLYLRDEPWSGDARAVLAGFERHYAVLLPTLAALDDGQEDLPIERHFADYLAEIETLAGIADRAEPAR